MPAKCQSHQGLVTAITCGEDEESVLPELCGHHRVFYAPDLGVHAGRHPSHLPAGLRRDPVVRLHPLLRQAAQRDAHCGKAAAGGGGGGPRVPGLENESIEKPGR